MLKKYRLFIFPKSSPSQNKHIFVRAKKVGIKLDNHYKNLNSVEDLKPMIFFANQVGLEYLSF